MQITHHFSTPFWVDTLNFDYAAVAGACLEIRNKKIYRNRTISNKGGWQSESLTFKQLIDNYGAFVEFYREFIRTIELVGTSIHPDIEVPTRDAQVWININEIGDWNSPHIHPGSSLSAVVYIQVDENTGSIVFTDGYTPMQHYPKIPFLSTRSLLRTTETFIPKQGMFLAFPSWVSHKVEPSKSTVTRISLATNLSMRQKQIYKKGWNNYRNK
jgi:uncharacterized protein (TIGR02466 family)